MSAPKSQTRAVDAAMVSKRAEKQTIRRLWAQKATEYFDENATNDGFVYLTLSGAEGLDIELLVEQKIIRLTETNSIDPKFQTKIAAIESNKQAIVLLQRKYPGLKIIEVNIANVLRGLSTIIFPDGEHRDICRARVVNLDLNAKFAANVEENEVTFPIATWIQKLGELHANTPRREWSLCLTLHGEIDWPKEANHSVQDFLNENFKEIDDLATSSKKLLGQKLYDRISGNRRIEFSNLTRKEQQNILMILVPKKIAQVMQVQGWKMSTERNLRYGRSGHAPMVTWIFNFTRNQQASTKPMRVYQENVGSILDFMGYIDGNGSIKTDK